MRRTALLYVVPAMLIVTGWLRLEEGQSDGRVVGLVLLALAPALVPRWWGRAAAAAVAVFVAIEVVLDLSVLDARPRDDRDFFGPVLDRLRDGFLEYYDVKQPFLVEDNPSMHEVLLLGVFGFCLALALALAARRPLVAVLVLLVGAVWPATLVPTGGDYVRGAILLAVVLLLLAVGGSGRPRLAYRPTLLAGAALIAASLAASASPAVAKEEFVEWRAWDLYDKPDDPVGVRYVWDANYGGITFPEKPTEVLTVQGPSRSHYWRAATLDVFDGDRWRELTPPEVEGVIVTGEEITVADPLLPVRARDPERWIRAEVTIEALRDSHLVAPSMPVAYYAGELGDVQFLPNGVAIRRGGLERDDRYSVWAYAPNPKPQLLARSRLTGAWADELRPFLELTPGAALPLFGDPALPGALDSLLTSSLYGPFLRQYEPLYAKAREVAGRPTTPYAAVVALEAWFRREGGFVYTEHPRVAFGVPPLVDFVTESKRGYCQHYAGAMALMLRSLGIPARVAVGFTSGVYDEDDQTWTVTDHNAHAWVEVWFQGWGWLPFDPTPARGQLSAPYTVSSETFAAGEANRLLELGGGALKGVNLAIRGELAESRVGGTTGQGTGIAGGARQVAERGGSLLQLLALIVLAAAALIFLGKLVLRRVRYVRRDPRLVASACRRELVDFLLDQRVPVARSATLGELGTLVHDEFRVDASPFVQAVGRARFGHPGEAADALPRARRRTRELRKVLRRRLGLIARARGAVSLRSLSA